MAHSAGNRLSASAPMRVPVTRSTIGCSTTTGPPLARTGSSRPEISAARSSSRTPGSMITEAAWARTSISALSRRDTVSSEAEPAAQNVPYSVPSLRTTGTET